MFEVIGMAPTFLCLRDLVGVAPNASKEMIEVPIEGVEKKGLQDRDRRAF